ncbi:hypothetical protein TNCV_4694351 [Trichonephila clavipes]|uniref:Uncharacterized protein n=1 Tax=Trichonephila clavipes TaxID=2585209 RepID=A0A8X7BH76_TRICX|nr:hypothetical protein TNCV_4694351 [Trichonephila clavipes]
MSWTYLWAVIVPWINIRGEGISFVAEGDLVPFHCSPISSCATPLQMESRWLGTIGSARNGRHNTKYFSARCFTVVREDTGVHTEGAACVWTAANEAVGSTRACRMM